MLIPAFLALLQSAQPPVVATSPPPTANPEPPAINITESVLAYTQWRMCIDAALQASGIGSPRRRADAAVADCSAQEDALNTATIAAFGPQGGAELMGRFRRDTRAQVGASPLRER